MEEEEEEEEEEEWDPFARTCFPSKRPVVAGPVGDSDFLSEVCGCRRDSPPPQDGLRWEDVTDKDIKRSLIQSQSTAGLHDLSCGAVSPLRSPRAEEVKAPVTENVGCQETLLVTKQRKNLVDQSGSGWRIGTLKLSDFTSTLNR
ncbi:hypothetical protein INR49_026938 [Caranx melampygus]|nr:hypothetical protein INR49_026938 [Caranx melampygus]